MSQVHIVIVDQQPVVEEGLVHFLKDSSDINLSASAQSGASGLALLNQVKVDLIVMDPVFPELDGAEVIRLFLAEKPDLGIVVYSARGDEISVYQALKAGARGYILKQSPVSELVDAIREVNRGGYALSPSLNPGIIEFYLEHRDESDDQFAGYQELSDREKQVFRLLAMGKQTAEIADLLSISPKTVAKHRVSIKKKLDLANSVEMAQYAIRLGLVNVDEV